MTNKKLFQSAEWRLWDLGREVSNGKASDFPRRFRVERKIGNSWRTIKGGLDRDDLMLLVEDLGRFVLMVRGEL